LAVFFDNPVLESARQEAKAATPEPINQAVLAYIAERNSKRPTMRDILFHRPWQPTDAGTLRFMGLRLVQEQNLALLSSGNEILILAINDQQRRHLAHQPKGIILTVSQNVSIAVQSQELER
jgi:hypothetical protein